MKPTRVLIVDDHALFREGLAGIISAQPDLQVIGEAGDGLEAIVKARELKPDLILMDIKMPGVDGIEATRLIKEEVPGAVVVMLTVQEDDKKLFEAIKYGAQGYLLKNISSKQMIRMLRDALEGKAALTPDLAGHVMEEFRRLSHQFPADTRDDTVSLTQREQEVLQHVAMGASDKEIADKLCISLHTVKSHVRNIIAKMQVSNRREAARLARHKGWV